MAQKKASKKASKAATSKKKTVKKAAVKKKAPAKVSASKKPTPQKKTSSKKAAAKATTKQTKKEALKASRNTGPVKEAAEAKKDKEIKKAKKALGKAKQSLAKARVKDLGSKLGKNLINQGAEELAKKWESLFKRADSIESKPYRMHDSFEERTAIEHKVLGWGFVLSNQNDRLEVLFRDGIRYLISNYKP